MYGWCSKYLSHLAKAEDDFWKLRMPYKCHRAGCYTHTKGTYNQTVILWCLGHCRISNTFWYIPGFEGDFVTESGFLTFQQLPQSQNVSSSYAWLSYTYLHTNHLGQVLCPRPQLPHSCLRSHPSPSDSYPAPASVESRVWSCSPARSGYIILGVSTKKNARVFV